MANIRRLNDLERRPLTGASPRDNYPILGSGVTLGSPEECRKESFGQMLTLICCPHFTYWSFTFWMTVLQTALFFLTVFVHYDSHSFLEPRQETLDLFGAKNAEKLHEFQVWRWLTPVLLHASATHLAYNMLMQLVLGFRLEPTVGSWRTVVVYFGSAFGGILLSAIGSPLSLAVGASTAIFGLAGSVLAWLLVNWSALEHHPARLTCLLWLGLFLISTLLLGLVLFK